MKKIISIIMIFIIMLSFTAMAENAPDVIGVVRSTDIKALINYMPIPTYNIDGKTVVILRDLENYGYVIEWDENARSVYFYFDGSGEFTPYIPYHVPAWDLLQKLFDVYSSDIKVYFAGKEIEAYNIGGKTAIKLRDLDIAECLLYDDEKRCISLVTDGNALTGENYEYVMGYFYDNFFSLTEGDYYHSLVSQIVKTNIYNNDYNEALVNFLDKFWKNTELYKYYQEPSHFSKSADELWWAIVNERTSTESMYNLVLAMLNEVSEPQLLDIYARSSQDSLQQRMEALKLLKAEILALKK